MTGTGWSSAGVVRVCMAIASTVAWMFVSSALIVLNKYVRKCGAACNRELATCRATAFYLFINSAPHRPVCWQISYGGPRLQVPDDSVGYGHGQQCPAELPLLPRLWVGRGQDSHHSGVLVKEDHASGILYGEFACSWNTPRGSRRCMHGPCPTLSCSLHNQHQCLQDQYHCSTGACVLLPHATAHDTGGTSSPTMGRCVNALILCTA
jgi:hypothetical protein